MVAIAIVGHVEWVHFVRVARLPRHGEIALARDSWAETAGGGAMAAFEVARLIDATGDRAMMFTAFGGDDAGGSARRGLERRGLRIEAVVRDQPHPIVFTQLTDDRERTITVLATPLGARGSDPLPWADIAGCGAAYFCKGDPGAVRAARAAPILVATARAAPVLAEADVDIDVLVLSGNDETEQAGVAAIPRRPAVVVTTDGARGGSYRARDGGAGQWAAAPVPGPIEDSYGAGDGFAGALTVGLARGLALDDAIALAARSAAAALCRAGAGQVR